jgi:diacylglycerol kinase family enzyme
MASTGFDAAVIHELAARRTGAISHWSYVPVILSQLRRWHAPEIWVTLDEEPERHLGRGVLVVGNLGEYGLRIDPVRVADGSDALLDGVFLPASGGMDAIAWGPKFLLTRTILNREVVGLPRFRCRTVTVRTEPGSVWQVDGDPLGAMQSVAADPAPSAQSVPVGQALQSVQLTLEPSALRVLLPPG